MIEEILSATKKYGATGVLACWLWVTSTKVSDLEDKLINCYEDQARITQVDTHRNFPTNHPLVAVLPDSITIKREDV
jgi:hypothetical protein